jgi:hypothetical protein
MRASWRDPTDTSPSAARTAREITGYRAYCPLRRCLQRHGSASSVTLRHIAAADQLRGLFDGSRLGFSGLRDWRPVTAIHYRPMAGPTRTALRQLRCRQDFDAAWSLFGDEERVLLGIVVLANTSINRLVEQRRAAGIPASANRLMERLTETLERLAEYFGEAIERHELAA